MFFDMLRMTLDDIKKDGNGKYRDKGRFVYVFRDGKRMERQRLFDHKQSSKTEFMLVKHYYKHVDDDNFSREIVYVSNSGYEYVHNAVMVLYSFSGVERTIMPSAHGNSRDATNSYTAVKKSVIQKVSSQS